MTKTIKSFRLFFQYIVAVSVLVLIAGVAAFPQTASGEMDLDALLIEGYKGRFSKSEFVTIRKEPFLKIAIDANLISAGEPVIVTARLTSPEAILFRLYWIDCGKFRIALINYVREAPSGVFTAGWPSREPGEEMFQFAKTGSAERYIVNAACRIAKK